MTFSRVLDTFELHGPEQARTALHEAFKLGPREARLFFHAGMIYHRLGDTVPARQYRQCALATNPYFHVLHADVAAQTLTTLTTPRGAAVSQEIRHGHSNSVP
jgi:tetratricopeptide (TPR) repeat protein